MVNEQVEILKLVDYSESMELIYDNRFVIWVYLKIKIIIILERNRMIETVGDYLNFAEIRTILEAAYRENLNEL